MKSISEAILRNGFGFARLHGDLVWAHRPLLRSPPPLLIQTLLGMQGVGGWNFLSLVKVSHRFMSEKLIIWKIVRIGGETSLTT